MTAVVMLFLILLLAANAATPDRFAPAHRLDGVGVSRDDLTDELVDKRADLMIQSQTFSIMREAQSLQGAKRVTRDPKLQALFKSAAASSGMPATILEAIAYLESWGEAKAESPAGPRGIMQISAATAASMGLKVTYATRYRVSRERVQVKVKGKSKPVYRNVTRRVAYRVPGRDDRLLPERAIPAAAR